MQIVGLKQFASCIFQGPGLITTAEVLATVVWRFLDSKPSQSGVGEFSRSVEQQNVSIDFYSRAFVFQMRFQMFLSGLGCNG